MVLTIGSIRMEVLGIVMIIGLVVLVVVDVILMDRKMKRALKYMEAMLEEMQGIAKQDRVHNWADYEED